MARIDPERGQLVVRIVYDGPAQAGKTTSVRALARSLGTGVFSGAEEEGRTLYFDWADYVGGLFEGMPIRCQIVSAPGQSVLESRRRLLLASADAVVFVVDSQPARMMENWRSFAVLHEVVSRERVPVGVVVQANKRDVPDAVSLDELRAAFGDALSLAMTEAVAERAEGVRETFVLAIRLALDRVRALWSAGLLEQRPPEFDSGDELLAAMIGDEDGAARGVLEASSVARVATVLAEEMLASSTANDGMPRVPDASVAPGLVWPPVQGRVIVHEAARHTIALTCDDDGTWRGVSGGGWELSSPAAASFADLEEGREALIAWARWHVAATPRLSAERAIVLAPSAANEWRLWQIVHTPRTLLDLCREAVQLRGRAAGDALFDLLDARAKAAELVASGVTDRVSMQLVALSAEGTPVYAGSAAYPPRNIADDGAAQTDAAIVERELLDILRAELSAAPARLPDLLAGIEAAAATRGRAEAGRLLRSGLLNT